MFDNPYIYFSADLPSQAKDIALRSVEAGHMVQNDEGTSGRHSGFIGSMQSFIFNGNHLFQVSEFQLCLKICLTSNGLYSKLTERNLVIYIANFCSLKHQFIHSAKVFFFSKCLN